MNNIWEYTWDADDVLDRHEWRYDIKWHYHGDWAWPINYPDWSDKRWKSVWHAHNKYLHDKKTREEQNRIEENRRIEYIRNSLKWIIAYLISDLAHKKDEKHSKVQEERD